MYIADVGEVFHSINQGQNWIKSIDSYGGDFTFGSVYALAPAPSDERILYAVKSGFGIFKSKDTGRTWQFLHQSEIDYTYTLAVHPENPQIILSGYNPKPFETYAKIRMSTDGGDTWTTPLKIPGASAVTSVEYFRVNPNIVFAGSSGEGGTVWRSTDGGESWQKANSSFDFTNLHFFTTDPHDPELAFGATWGGGTWITPDGGKTWEGLKNDPTISASAVLISPGEKGRIFLSDRTSP